MSLYDDIDTDKKPEGLSGWASGIKFLQNHMQLKKATLTQPKRDPPRKHPHSMGIRMAPVVDLKSKAASSSNDNDDSPGGTGAGSLTSSIILPYSSTTTITRTDKKGKTRVVSSYLSTDPEWQFDNEYDPLYPNDYEKALKEMRERRDKEAEEHESRRKQETDEKEDEDEFPIPSRKDREPKSGGVAIAPPPSLTQSVVSAEYGDDNDRNSSSKASNMGKGPQSSPHLGLGAGSGASAAARIMAKYGYKEGQGLGKKEQGMSTALQVEKTSHRTGRIIHERDVPKEGVVLTNPLGFMGSSLASSYIDDEDEIKIDPLQLAAFQDVKESVPVKSMADTPSKVVLLTNMVGPGQVDDDLEPEVKEECEKYGSVVSVTVFQMPDVDSDDSIRIFVEFQSIDGARKAIADLNGRYFGGREVRAHFYDVEKFNNLELTA